LLKVDQYVLVTKFNLRSAFAADALAKSKTDCTVARSVDCSHDQKFVRFGAKTVFDNISYFRSVSATPGLL